MKFNLKRFIPIMLLTTLVLMTSCIFRSGYPSGPIKWSMVSGDGSWNSIHENGLCHLLPVKQTATIRLDNTGSENLWVLINIGGPPDYITFHLEGAFVRGGNVLEV